MLASEKLPIEETPEEVKRDLREARAALREAEKRGTIPLDQLKRDLGL